MAVIPVSSSIDLQLAIKNAQTGDILDLTAANYESIATLGKIKPPAYVVATGYTVRGNQGLNPRPIIQDTRIYQQNTDSNIGPDFISNLDFNYNAGGGITSGRPLLSYNSTFGKPSRSITINSVGFTGIQTGWNGNGNMYMSLRSFDVNKPTNISLTLQNSSISIAGQGGFNGTSGGSAFLQSRNNAGSVALSGVSFNEAGFFASFRFENDSTTANTLGSYLITGSQFIRTSNSSVRDRGNTLSNVTATAVTNNTFSGGAYLDLYGASRVLDISGNTFQTIADGFGIRVNAPFSGTTTFTGVNTFSGSGVPLKFVSATSGSYNVNGSFNISLVGLQSPVAVSSMVAGSQVNDVIALTSVSSWANGDHGDDQITGGTASDYLRGGSGNDVLRGGAGTAVDYLWGDDGNDLLIGDRGNDILTGGAGADSFRWLTTADANDRITDFSIADGDQMQLTDVFAGTNPGSTLNAADFLTATNLGSLTAANSGKITKLTTAQRSQDMDSTLVSGLSNAFVLVYDTSFSNATLYYDENWGDTLNRRTPFRLQNFSTLASLDGITNNQFYAI